MKGAHWLLAGTIFLIGVSAAALASADEGGWYVGGGLGRSDDDGLDDEDSGFKVFGGYRFSRHLALEGAVVELGDDLGPADFIKDGLAVEVLGMFPISERFELFAKAGFFIWEVRVDSNEFECFDFDGGFICFEDEEKLDDGTDPIYGVGVEYRFGERWNVRGEWERFMDVGDSDVDLLSVGVVFRF